MSDLPGLGTLLERYAQLAADYEAVIAGQFDFIGGSIDDGFNAQGGTTGARGYYPLENAEGDTVYVPCLQRIMLLATGGGDVSQFDEILGLSVQAATTQADIAAARAADAAASVTAAQIAAAAVGDGVATATAKANLAATKAAEAVAARDAAALSAGSVGDVVTQATAQAGIATAKATAAEGSATAAAGSADAAEGAAETAAGHAATASAAATAATTKAGEAAASATAAATTKGQVDAAVVGLGDYVDDAAAQAAAAAGSATEAAGHRDAALGYQTGAQAARDLAEDYRDAAQTYAAQAQAATGDALLAGNNLVDLPDKAQARTNLGLGALATKANVGPADYAGTHPIAKGGTGATTAADARTALGLLALATKDTVASADFTGTLSIAKGGTGAVDAATARGNLGITQAIADAVAALVGSVPTTLDTLDELAEAMGNDPAFATTVATALGNRLRIDAAQGLSGGQQAQGLANLGVTLGAAAGNVPFLDGNAKLAAAIQAVASVAGLSGAISAADLGAALTAAGSVKVRESIIIAAGDETTAIAVGNGKVTLRVPYAFTVTEVRGSLATAQASGSALTFDVKAGGVTIFGTKPSFNNASKTTVGGPAYTMAAAAALASDAEITIDVTQIGNGSAKGLKIALVGYQP